MPLFRALLRADAPLAVAWYGLVLVRGLLPAAFAVVIGEVVATRGEPALIVLGVIFLLLQVATPITVAVSTRLGHRTAAWLYDRLTEACVTPPGMEHLEDADLARDLVVARDFDLGMTGPPLAISLDFIAGGLVDMIGGVSSAGVLFAFTWWAPLVLAGGWLSTHWLLRESAVWRDRNTDEVRLAQKEAEYLYRLAVDPPAAKEIRMFGLADWLIERFTARRARLHKLQYDATRLRERSLIWSLLVVCAANLAVFWALAHSGLAVGALATYAMAAIGASLIAFGGLNWALDGAVAPVAAVLRMQQATEKKGRLPSGTASADSLPAREIRFRDVTFAYPGSDRPVLDHFDLTIPAGTSLAIVGQNGAGKTTLAKLLCRLYDPQSGAIEVDGVDIRTLDLASWRRRLTAVFQDFIRFEWTLRDNVAPGGAPDADVQAALEAAGATFTGLDTVMSKGYEGGRDLSGGQWQRVAMARALCSVRRGAGVVLLDEPTAQLDVRGEAEIFGKLLEATRACTTLLISHRFSTVRQADRIAVVENGRVVELGTHEELMALRGRYQTMYELQASRFASGGAMEGEEDMVYDTL